MKIWVLTMGLLVPSFAAAQDDGMHHEDANHVPQQDSMAIGAGLNFPTDVLTFTRISVKARLSRVQIEPFVGLGISSGSVTEEIPGSDKSENKVSGNELTLGTTVYYPLAAHGNLELQALGTLRISRTSNKDDPEGDDNTDTVTNTAFSLDYGLAIEWWFSEHLSISARASNPVIGFSSMSSESEVGSGEKTKGTSSSTGVGLNWKPTVGAVLNIWF